MINKDQLSLCGNAKAMFVAFLFLLFEHFHEIVFQWLLSKSSYVKHMCNAPESQGNLAVINPVDP